MKTKKRNCPSCNVTEYDSNKNFTCAKCGWKNIIMKTYKILLEINAECEDDMQEVIECYEKEHPCELEWWCEVNDVKEELMECEVCHEKKSDVRFEGEVEMNICDKCLEKKKKENPNFHYCQDNCSNINHDESICSKCGNTWKMGDCWKLDTPSNRGLK